MKPPETFADRYAEHPKGPETFADRYTEWTTERDREMNIDWIEPGPEEIEAGS